MTMLTRMLNWTTTGQAHRYHGKTRWANSLTGVDLRDITFSRSSGGVYCFDADGILRFAKASEASIDHARRVENKLVSMSITDSRNLATGGFTVGSGASVTRDSTVLTDDGLASNKITWSEDTDNADITTGTIASAVADKRAWIMSVKMRAGTGTTCVIGITDGTDTFIDSKTVTLTTSWQIFSVPVSSVTAASAVVAPRITRGGVNYIYVDWIQFEDTTGASVQVFGGYVDVLTRYGAGVPAVKYFPSTNGNTRNATTGVVTEANGTALTDCAVVVEKAGTNLIAAANYRDISTWTITGGSMAATTPVLIDGVTGSSGKNEVQENSANSEHRVAIAFTAATSAKQSARVHVKRGTGTRHVQVRLNNATNGDYGSVTYNLDTLATIGSTTSEYNTAYNEGNYTVIELVDTNGANGTQNLYVNLHDGSSNSYTGDGASTLVVDWAQVITHGFAQTAVVGAATRDTTFYRKPWIGVVNNFWVYVKFKPMFTYTLQGTNHRLWTVYYNATNFIRFSTQTNGQFAVIRQTTAQSSQSRTTGNVNWTRGDTIRAIVTWDRFNGLRQRISKNGGTAVTQQTAADNFDFPLFVTNTTNLELGYFETTLQTDIVNARFFDWSCGTGVLTTDQMADMIGA